MRYYLILAMIVLFVLVVFAQETGQLPNFHHPQSQIYTAGQPTEAGFRQAAAFGIRTVINVLPANLRIPEEVTSVTSNDMTYVVIPFNTDRFSMQTVERFADALYESEKPILVHCSTGNHVGGMWFCYRAILQRAPLWTAMREAREIGMKPELEEKLFPWVTKQLGQTAKKDLVVARAGS